jgi:hypothetical protein
MGALIMKRSILAFLAALITWTLVASLVNRALRYGFDGYAAAEPAMTFTLGMMLARLAMGAVSSLAAGAVMAFIAPNSTRTPWVFAVLVLAAFIPSHIRLWALFPVWYHLTFLVTLVPLVILGWHLAKMRNPRVQAAVTNSI